MRLRGMPWQNIYSENTNQKNVAQQSMVKYRAFITCSTQTGMGIVRDKPSAQKTSHKCIANADHIAMVNVRVCAVESSSNRAAVYAITLSMIIHKMFISIQRATCIAKILLLFVVWYVKL